MKMTEEEAKIIGTLLKSLEDLPCFGDILTQSSFNALSNIETRCALSIINAIFFDLTDTGTGEYERLPTMEEVGEWFVDADSYHDHMYAVLAFCGASDMYSLAARFIRERFGHKAEREFDEEVDWP